MVTLNATLQFQANGAVFTSIKEHCCTLYYVQQNGFIFNPSLFLDISSQVLYSAFGNETGLLALAFHPNDNRFFL